MSVGDSLAARLEERLGARLLAGMDAAAAVAASATAAAVADPARTGGSATAPSPPQSGEGLGLLVAALEERLVLRLEAQQRAAEGRLMACLLARLDEMEARLAARLPCNVSALVAAVGGAEGTLPRSGCDSAA